MDAYAFAQLLVRSIIHGLKVDALVAWNMLVTHPWMIVVVTGAVTLRLIARLAERLQSPRRRSRRAD